MYAKHLFEGYYETCGEVKSHLEQLVGEHVSEAFVRKIFRKLAFVRNTCCLLMAETEEIWQENTYRCFLEYAIEHDDFAVPEKICGDTRSALLEYMPAEFVELVTRTAYDSCEDFRM